MKKIHIGSKINLVEVPEYPKCSCGHCDHEYQIELQHAIDNPIAEFEDNIPVLKALKVELGKSSFGLHDIPEGYRVEVKRDVNCSTCGANEDQSCRKDPRDCDERHDRYASLVPIKEEMRDQMVTVLKQMGLDAVKVEDVDPEPPKI